MRLLINIKNAFILSFSFSRYFPFGQTGSSPEERNADFVFFTTYKINNYNKIQLKKGQRKGTCINLEIVFFVLEFAIL